MADLLVVAPGEGGSAFKVALSDGYASTAPEQLWSARMATSLLGLAGMDAEASVEARAARDEFVGRLRARAEQICALLQPGRDEQIAEALRDLDWDSGRYQERLDRINAAPFSVERDMDAQGRITDLRIIIRDKTIPPDKQQFKVVLDQAVTVVKTVFGDVDADVPEADAAPTGLSKWLRALLPGPTPLAQSKAEALRVSEYLRALYGIARVGLINRDATQTAFATLAMNGFRNEFVTREAGRVKNRYVRKLGHATLLALLACTLAYVAATHVLDVDTIAYRYRNFFVLAGGAAVGTWLSFSIRRQVLTFDDLATLEDDRLNPGFRIMFMIALTVVVQLIFLSGIVVLTMGRFRTDLPLTGAYAALIGALCGIAERSLTGAVGKRATELVAGLGGTGKPAA